MFLPIGDDNSRITITPFVVYGMFVLNCLFWLLQLSAGASFTYGYSTVPLEITRGVDLVEPQLRVIAGHPLEIPQAPGPSPIYLTILTSMFMHGSWLHIIGNMVYLLIFGDQIEDYLGHFKFLLFYLACGIAATAAHIMFNPDSVIPSLGASGAIAGVLGAYLVKFTHNRVHVLFVRVILDFPAYVVLGGWFLLQFFGHVGTAAGEATGVAYMAHIGGFIAGVSLILIMPPKHRGATKGRRRR